jgi:hypothetical protein
MNTARNLVLGGRSAGVRAEHGHSKHLLRYLYNWRSEMRTEFWLESLKGRDHSEDLDVNGRIILKWILGI